MEEYSFRPTDADLARIDAGRKNQLKDPRLRPQALDHLETSKAAAPWDDRDH